MGSWELDLRSNKVTCSRNYYTLIGRQPDGKELSVDEFNSIVYPDDKQLLDEKLQEMYRTREVSSLDFRLIMPDGQIKWVQNNIVPEFDGKILVALRGVNIDITDKKLAEKEILDLNSSLENKVAERTKEVREINDRLEKDIAERMRVEEELLWNQTLLQLMAESSPLGFLVVDNRTDKILYFNHRFCQIWEIQSIEDQMHRGELKNNDIIPYCLPVLADISAFSESCKPLQSEENRISIEDEIAFTENRTIRRFSTQIRGEKDEYYGRFYIFEDITGQKRTQEDIIRSRDSAEKANHAKSEFLSRMSHELRTPMNSILGFAQLLEFSELGPRQMKGVKHILNSGKLLLNLINEVLDISRIESGRLTLSPEPVHLKGVIEEVLDTVQPLANEREIRLELTDTSSNQLFIISDRKRLKQVLLNLLNNAVKYNRQGGTILVNTESKPTNTAGSFNVRISVTDNGFGIHSDDIPKLFVPFERIGADQSNTEGTGLGLAIVKRIVNAMEGTFGVESVVGEGSTFWIELPQTENQVNSRNRKDDFRKHSYQNDPVTKTAEGVLEKSGTILYIEDNIQNAQLVEEFIESYRPKIHLIISMYGSSAVKLATDHQPGLILLDLDLPDVQGSEVLKNLQADPKTRAIPVVILTADAMPQQVEKLMTSGASDYLTKPLDLRLFLQVVDEWIVGI
jgi:PAS domain S-box-containing protein